MAIAWSMTGAAVILAVGLWSITTGHARSSPLLYLAAGFAHWVPIAFASGFAFACLISVAGRWRGLPWLTPARGAAVGGLMGAAIMVRLIPRGVASESVAWTATLLIGALGAIIGGGVVWMAARAPSKPDLLPDAVAPDAEFAATESKRHRVPR
jgi:hypothetical protein